MKLYYVTSARLSHEQAHNIQILKMCEAFSVAGAEVILVVPMLGPRTDVYTAYGVQNTFKIKYVPTINLPLSLPGAYGLLSLSFVLAARLWLATQKGKALIYTRGEVPLLIAPLLPKRFSLIWETHIKPAHPQRYKKVVERSSIVVAITKYYADEIPKLWHVNTEKVVYAPDAVAIEDFAHTQPKNDSRKRLGLPLDKKIALYAGRIDSWKGVDILLEASNILTENMLVVIVGGTEKQIAEYITMYPKVFFTGYQPYTDLPNNQAAADVLVLTGDPKSEIAQRYTSPLKLFTYMASGVPIVAFDLPVYRDVLSEKNAYFCEANPTALAQALEMVITTPSEAQARAAQALQDVQQYTWIARAKTILTAASA